MFSVFTSSKKLKVQTTATPEQVIDEFKAWTAIAAGSSGVESTGLILADQPSGSGKRFQGTMDKHQFQIRYANGIRNSLQPTMHVHIGPSATGGSLITTYYRTTTFTKVFLVFWICLASVIALFESKLALNTGRAPALGFAFPLSGVALLVLMRALAIVDEKALEKLVKDVASSAEKGPGQGICDITLLPKSGFSGD